MFFNRQTTILVLAVVLRLIAGPAGVRSQAIHGEGFIDMPALLSAQDGNPAAGSVDLYSGQHIETIPLVELTGRGGLKVELGLIYDGCVKEIITSQNYLRQASPFGLGFRLQSSFGFEYIFVDHNNTAAIADDKYQLVVYGSPIELREIEQNQYVPAHGRAWIVTRHVESGSPSLVTGFEITREDGTVFQFGDLDPDTANWDATQNIARYGYDVRPFSMMDEPVALYPHQWHLKRVQDAENLNWLEFSYSRDSIKVSTGAPGVADDDFVTRATYLSHIVSSDGQAVLLYYEPRSDFQPHYDAASGATLTGLWDFHWEQRIDQIHVRSATGDTTLTIQFDFDLLDFYHGLEYTDEFDKLLLASLQTMSGSLEDSLPPYRFEYYTDSLSESVGSIRRIIYPSGLVKEVLYGQVEDNSNFTMLDLRADSADFSTTSDYRVSVADNLVLHGYGSYANTLPLNVEFWDGYWHKLDSTGVIGSDAMFQRLPQPWHENWFVYACPQAKQYVVLRWQGGYWHADTLDYVDQTKLYASLYQMRDGFLALKTGWSEGQIVDIVCHYSWDGNEWTGAVVATLPQSYRIGQVKIAADVFAIAYGDYNVEEHLLFGKYDSRLQSVSTVNITETNFQLWNDKFVVGPNLVGYITAGPSDCHIYRYGTFENGWNEVYNSSSVSLTDCYGIALMPFGVVWNYREDAWNHHCMTMQYTDDFDQFDIYIETNTNVATYTMKGGGACLIGRKRGLYAWENENWVLKSLITSSMDDSVVVMPFPTGVVAMKEWSDPFYFFEAHIYEGQHVWRPLAPSYGRVIGDFAASSNLFLLDYNTRGQPGPWTFGRSLFAYDPFCFSFWDLDSLGTIGDQLGGVCNSQYAAGNTLGVLGGDYSDEQTDPELKLFKHIDRRYEGKARLTVVDTVLIRQSLVDLDPIILTYDYHAGLIDQSGNRPRFGKVVSSSAHYASDTAIAYMETHFFNDIDSTAFYDNSVYDGTIFPDLKDESLYGRINGGFLLDGRVYLTDSYTEYRVEPENVYVHERDSVRTLYSVNSTQESLFGVYRVHIDKVIDQEDGVSVTTEFSYDDLSGLRTATHRVTAPGLVKIDSVLHAHHFNSQMFEDNAIQQVGSAATYEYDMATQTFMLADTSHLEYELHGSWQLSVAKRFRIDELGFHPLTSTVNSWDAYGNVTERQNARGVRTALLHDERAMRNAARVDNGGVSDFLWQGFEYSNGWDSWISGSSEFKYYDSTTSFTGNVSYRMVDDPNLQTVNWGPRRTILVSDLSDTLYHVSAWVKSNIGFRIWYHAQDGLGVNCPVGDHIYFDGGDGTEWHRIDKMVNLSIASDPCVEQFVIQLSTENGDAASVAYFDDLRFHPENALMSTWTYDPVTYQTTSASDLNNIPQRFGYDGLSRQRTVRTWDNQLTDSCDYYNLGDSLGLYSWWSVDCQEDTTGTFRDSMIVTEAAICQYSVTVGNADGVGGPNVYVWLNDPGSGTYLGYASPGSPCVGDSSVQIGDEVLVYCNSIDEDVVIRGDFVFRSTGLPALPLQTPSYERNVTFPSQTDRSESVAFRDVLGRELQVRSEGPIGGTEPTTLVTAKAYDARGRVLREYKTFQDAALGNSVLTFEPIESLLPRLMDYYSATGEGPDCGDYPFREYKYQGNRLGRREEVLFEGDFRAYPAMYGYDASESQISGFGGAFYGIDSLFRRREVNENGSISVTFLDKTGRIIARVDDSVNAGINATTLYYHDHNGNDTLIIQPEGQQIRREYNNLGWPWKAESGDFGAQYFVYDQVGNLRFIMTATDAAVGDTRHRYAKYDHLNRRIEEGYIFGYLGWFSSDMAENPYHPSPATIDTADYCVTGMYEYDRGEFGLGRLARATRYASGHSDSASWEEYTYDAYGRVVEKKQHVHVLDAGTDTRDIAVEYNNLGQTTRMTYNVGGYVNYQYDRAGRVSEVENSYEIFRAQFEYWPTGQVKTQTLGYAPAQVVDYKYNARDWLLSINDGEADSGTTGNSDHFGLDLSYASGAYQGLQSEFPTGYHNGNIASYEASVSDNLVIGGIRSTSQSFAYDALDRLAGESFAGIAAPDAQLYHYDRNGNIDSVMDDIYDLVKDYQYHDGTNRLKSTRTGTYEDYLYTPSGSIYDYVRDDMDLGYNLHEQLARRVMDGSLYRDTVRYWYNTSGQRIAKKFNYYYMSRCWSPGDSVSSDPFPLGGSLIPLVDSLGDTTWLPLLPDSLGDSLGFGGAESSSGDPVYGYWYDCPRKDSIRTAFYYLGDDLMFDYECRVLSVLIGNYVYANGERIGKFEGSSTYAVEYYLTDHLGSVVASVDYDGDLKVRNLYRPWGKKLSSYVSGGFENQFQYTGHYQDEDLSLELTYCGQRYYDQGLKIFTSVDPLAHKHASWGSYVYSFNNPIKYFDPNGKEPWYFNGWPGEIRYGDWVAYSSDPLKTFDAGFRQHIRETTGQTGRKYEYKGGRLELYFSMPSVRFREGYRFARAQWNDTQDRPNKNEIQWVFGFSMGGYAARGTAAFLRSKGYIVMEVYYEPFQAGFNDGKLLGSIEPGPMVTITGSGLPDTQTPFPGGAHIELPVDLLEISGRQPVGVQLAVFWANVIRRIDWHSGITNMVTVEEIMDALALYVTGIQVPPGYWSQATMALFIIFFFYL